MAQNNNTNTTTETDPILTDVLAGLDTEKKQSVKLEFHAPGIPTTEKSKGDLKVLKQALLDSFGENIGKLVKRYRGMAQFKDLSPDAIKAVAVIMSVKQAVVNMEGSKN